MMLLLMSHGVCVDQDLRDNADKATGYAIKRDFT